MFSESACQVSRRWDDMGSFCTHLFGVIYMTCNDFHDGSEKGTVSVHQILCQSWEKFYGNPRNDLTRLPQSHTLKPPLMLWISII
jgi:hypothetical protein